MDYEAQQQAILEKWITPADAAHIEAEVRGRAFSFEDPQEVRRKVTQALSEVARDIEHVSTDLLCWSHRGILEITSGYFSVPPKNVPYDADVLVKLNEYCAEVAKALTKQEEEDEPLSESEALLRWLEVTPYVLFRFRLYVVEAAADAARDAVLDLLDDQVGMGLVRTTRKASEDWMQAWQQKGRVL